MSAAQGMVGPDFEGIDDLLQDARARLERVSPQQAYAEAREGAAIIVDTRPQAQRESEGSLPDEVNPLLVERNVLEWRFDPRQQASLPQASMDARVIVVCQEGYSSSLAADALRSIGVSGATDLIGGFAAWRDAGLPTD